MKSLLILCAVFFQTNLFATVSNKEIKIELNQDKSVDHHSYYFGTVNVNLRTSVRYKVTNTGTTPLVFQKALISGGSFDARHSCRNGLLPNEVCSFTINYWPMFEGYHFGRFNLMFDQSSEIIVDVSGQARR